MVNNNDLTMETYEQLTELVNSKKGAFNLLVDNYKDKNKDGLKSSELVARLQTQYFALNRNENNIKGLEDWDQNEFNEVSEVNTLIPQITKGKYSSFALKALENDYELKYPMDDDYSSEINPFAETDIADSDYEKTLRLFERKLNIRVNNNELALKTSYKKSKTKNALIKIKNVFLKVAKKSPNLSANFSGKINLQTKVAGYPVSNLEKTTKILDSVLKVVIKKQAKATKKQSVKLTKDVKFAARLFANILMARVMDYNNPASNKTVEKCLWLQFANVLNRYNFNSEQLKTITKLGTNSAITLTEALGISKENIIKKMTQLGYSYNIVPKTKEDAFLAIREKDYTKYIQTEEVKTETAEEVKEIVKNEPVVEEIKEEVNEESKELIAQSANEVFNEPYVANFESMDEYQEYIEDIYNALGDEAFMEKEIKSSNFRLSTVEKMIDNVVIKNLASCSAKLTDKINNNEFKGKKLEKAKQQSNMLSLVLTYYVQGTNKKVMSTNNGNAYIKTEIENAKFFANNLISKRNGVAKVVFDNSNLKEENQSPNTFANAYCQQYLGKNVRSYFIGLIKDGVAEYLKSVNNVNKVKYIPNFEILSEEEAQERREKNSEYFEKA